MYFTTVYTMYIIMPKQKGWLKAVMADGRFSINKK